MRILNELFCYQRAHTYKLDDDTFPLFDEKFLFPSRKNCTSFLHPESRSKLVSFRSQSPFFTSSLLLDLVHFSSAFCPNSRFGCVRSSSKRSEKGERKEKRREEKELRVESINQSFTIDREGWLGRLAKASN